MGHKIPRHLNAPESTRHNAQYGDDHLWIGVRLWKQYYGDGQHGKEEINDKRFT